ncbi:hypothetical protein HID58_071903 [Brassica napus]|uniref:(rape) hypothetical protein n=1 Tax=Brassica napus TaxID=3708 RepID=A0A816QKV0_BRANA|nr:hypothetical protein HID58_071903 [Brassica napus]CAF2060631.1 unnamed protein product [Brassica napus]
MAPLCSINTVYYKPFATMILGIYRHYYWKATGLRAGLKLTCLRGQPSSLYSVLVCWPSVSTSPSSMSFTPQPQSHSTSLETLRTVIAPLIGRTGRSLSIHPLIDSPSRAHV